MIAAIPFNQIEDLTAKFLNFWLDGWAQFKGRSKKEEGRSKNLKAEGRIYSPFGSTEHPKAEGRN
jgi:hypothetical protein